MGSTPLRRGVYVRGNRTALEQSGARLTLFEPFQSAGQDVAAEHYGDGSVPGRRSRQSPVSTRVAAAFAAAALGTGGAFVAGGAFKPFFFTTADRG